MRSSWLLLAILLLAALSGGQTTQTTPADPAPLDYYCPMDPDVRAAAPGKCPRCGMKLVFGIPEPVEFPLQLTLDPRAPKPGAPVLLTFQPRDPKTAAPVTRYETVHEKLFHLFIVSQDLEYFVHQHPVAAPSGSFRYQGALPKPGMYRVLADYYPSGATPQLTAKTIFVPGGHLAIPKLTADLAPRNASNLDVSVTLDPPKPLAGFLTRVTFHVAPAAGLEPYLGAWGHMLAASDDLIDLIHTHPFLADGGPDIQFNLIFPRARTYRLWVQFQRQGVVNTAAFTIPVEALQ